MVLHERGQLKVFSTWQILCPHCWILNSNFWLDLWILPELYLIWTKEESYWFFDPLLNRRILHCCDCGKYLRLTFVDDRSLLSRRIHQVYSLKIESLLLSLNSSILFPQFPWFGSGSKRKVDLHEWKSLFLLLNNCRQKLLSVYESLSIICHNHYQHFEHHFSFFWELQYQDNKNEYNLVLQSKWYNCNKGKCWQKDSFHVSLSVSCL